MDQLPVGLLAQLVERCTSITEVMGSNPVQALIFFKSYFSYQFSSVRRCEDLTFISSPPCTCMNFIYLKSL